MRTVKIESSFTPSNLNKTTAAGFEALDQKFVQISKETKEELFTRELKIDYFDEPTDCEINLSQIFSPPAFTRHNHSNSFEDLDALDNNPELIKVVRAEDVKGFFVIDGQRRMELHKSKSKKEKKIKAVIVGRVVCRSQIAMARALEMTRFKRPPNTLELVQGLLSLHEIIINDFGNEAFFSHGGNRKGEQKGDKLSLSQYIANVLGLKKSTVNLLLNFGLRVSPYGLAGLHYHEDMQKIAIRTINRINGGLKKENLPKKLSEMFHSLHGAKTTDPERIKTCGNLAREIICSHITALTEGDNKDEEGEEFEQFELDPSDFDLPPERGKKPKGPKAEEKNPDNESGDNEAEKSDDENEDSNLEDEIKEALKVLKRFKYLVPQFESTLRDLNPLEKTVQNNLCKDLGRFNTDAENMISFIKKKITDLKLGN